MGLFYKGWTVERCIQTYKSLATEAFKPRKRLNIPFLGRIYELIITYLADSKYPSKAWEEVLADVFGRTETILDPSYATKLGTRLLLTATSMLGRPTIFHNYSRAPPQNSGQGEILRQFST
jgi:hypothetical protein